MLPNEETSKFFAKHKLQPPEHIPHLKEEEVEQLLENNRRNRSCEYRQRGNRVYCISCPMEHGNLVPPDVQLQGTDKNGLPIFKRIVLSK